MERNIKFLKYILILSTTWFWCGIWLVYYLKWTDYAGVGLMEATMFFVGFTLEIPTGAISDLIGKKKGLITFFIFSGIGEIVMSQVGSYASIFAAVFLLVIGHAFYSGTVEALIYDTFKSLNREAEYENYLAKVNTYQFAGLALASIIGGYLYTLNNGLPFLITGVIFFIGAILTQIFVTEPAIDTEKFSLKIYLKQNFSGFKLLFANKNIAILVLIFVTVISLKHMFIQVLDNSFAIEIGYTPVALGVLFSLLPFVSSLSSHAYPWLKKKITANFVFYGFAVIFFVSAILSSQLNFVIAGTMILIFRAFYDPLADVYVSQRLNEQIPSSARATAISTFTMIRALPYILLAYFLGDFSDKFAPSAVISVISTIFFIAFVVLVAWRSLSTRNKTTS